MLVIFLVACSVVFAEGIVCPHDYCQNLKCADLSGCEGKIKPNGGICGCCSTCVDILGENERCTSFLLLMGVPSGKECDTGLHCSPSTGTCVKTLTKRPVSQGPCAKEELNRDQNLRMGEQFLKCDADDDYKPVQCEGSVCYCVDQFGAEIQGYSVTIGADDYATRNCQCARDKNNYAKSNLIGKTFDCEANGNYKQYKCEGSVCFCVDNEGKRVGTRTVNIGLLPVLKCSK